jgi:hypothetical protein
MIEENDACIIAFLSWVFVERERRPHDQDLEDGLSAFREWAEHTGCDLDVGKVMSRIVAIHDVQ